MKPFNLEEAKAGKKVVTRDGRNARIITFDKVCDDYPIIALIDKSTAECRVSYTIDGSYLRLGSEHYLDLFMADDEPKQESSELQAWCREILPVVQAAANGEEIERWDDDGWYSKDSSCFDSYAKYRIKPKVKMVNGFEVPMHETVAPDFGTTYYTPNIHQLQCYTRAWRGDSTDYDYLANRIVYLDKESATKCAKAMLGINPEEE